MRNASPCKRLTPPYDKRASAAREPSRTLRAKQIVKWEMEVVLNEASPYKPNWASPYRPNSLTPKAALITRVFGSSSAK